MATTHVAKDLMMVLLAASAEAYLMKTVTPEYILHHRISRSILYLFFVNAIPYFGYKCFIYPFFLSPFRKLPGPKGNPFWGNATAQFSKPPGQEMLNWVKTIPNDGLISFRSFGNDWRLMPTSPAMLKQVLSDKTYDWQKPEPVISFLVRILGLGLILAEGAVHKFQRKNLLPSFQFGVIKELYPLFWSKGRQMVEAIERQHISGSEKGRKVGKIEFNDWTTRVTLDIIGIAGFGQDFNAVDNVRDEMVQNYEELLDPDASNAIFFAFNLLFPKWLVDVVPVRQNGQLKRITQVLKDYSLDLVQRRRREAETKGLGDEQKDILSNIVKSGQFKDREIADQVLTMLAAGHETTSSALTWVAYLLAVNPGVQARLRDEIRAHVASLDEPVTSQVIEAMPYLNAVCNETLRLYPTVPLTIRESITDTTLGELPVRKGTTLMLVPWAINRSPELWGERADVFDPERWMQEGTANTGGAGSNYAVITFLHGPRSCIGQGFARSELKCLAAAFFGRYRVELDMPESEVFPAGVVTTKPKNGMHIKVEVVEGW